MFYGIFDDERNNPVDNPNIYNVEGDNRLLPGLQSLTTGIVLKIFFFFSPVLQFYFLKPEIILLSSTKQNIQVLDILRVVSV